MAQQVDLRGHGGAAFPAARKLQAVIDAARKNGQPTIVVVNATEGEPASCKDKMLLTRSPHLILDGAALAAYAIDAEEIVVGIAGNDWPTGRWKPRSPPSPACATWCGRRRRAGPVHLRRGRRAPGQREKPRPARPKTLAAEGGGDGCPPCCPTPRPSPSSPCSRCSDPSTRRSAAGGTRHRPAHRERLGHTAGGRRVPTGAPLGTVLDICEAPAGDGVLVGGYHGMWLPPERRRRAGVARRPRGRRRHPRRGHRPPARRRDLPARRGRAGRELPRRGVRRAVRSLQAGPAGPGPALAALTTAPAASRRWTSSGAPPPPCRDAARAPIRTA